VFQNRFSPWLLPAVAVALLVGCAKPLPDADGTPGGARSLELNVSHSDRLDCKARKQPDCLDWFVVRVPAEGEVDFEVAGNNPRGLTPDFAVVIANHRGEPLERASNEGGSEVRITWSGTPGAYFVAVSSGASKTILQYDIVARYELPPSPPPPRPDPPRRRFETTSWMVLEIEVEQGQPSFVLIHGGARNGLREGLRGRLIERGKRIAEIEIVEVFEEGSRARIATPLAGQITPQTTAEIDVPVKGAP
jgi:hypothetical protein